MDDFGGAVGMLVAAVGSVAGLTYLVRRNVRLTRAWTDGVAALKGGKFAEAEGCFRRSLALAEERFGKTHWRTAFHLGALSEALVQQKKLEEARPLMQRALALHDAMRLQPAPQWPVLLVQAAYVEAAQGHLDRAWGHLERARLEADGALLGSVMLLSARLMHMHERWAAAVDLLVQVPVGCFATVDVRLLGKLATRMKRDGDVERALACMTKMVSLLDRPFRRRPERAFYLARMGELLVRAGRDAEARARLQQAIAAYERHVGPDHPVLAPLLVTLAETQARLGDLAASRATCRRAAALSCMAERTGERPYRTSDDARDPLADERRRVQQLLLTSAAGSPGAPAS